MTWTFTLQSCVIHATSQCNVPGNHWMKGRFIGHLQLAMCNDVCETCDMVNKKKGLWETQEKTKYSWMSKQNIYVQYQGHNTNVQSPSQQTAFTTYDMLCMMILCRSCDSILDEPVELPCKQMICCSCYFDHLNNIINSFCCCCSYILWIATDPNFHESADDTL